MFARLQEFRCTQCDKKFIGAEINHCSQHPSHADFQYNQTFGVYPCCNSKATRFSAIASSSNCTATNHRIKAGSPRKTVASRAKNFEMLLEHFKVACEPYYYERENYSTGETETKIQLSDMIDEDKSLQNLVLAYTK